MKRYFMSMAASFTHKPEHPERTAKKQGAGMNFDVTYQVWPNRKSLAKSINMQRSREGRSDDWSACVKLLDYE